MYSTMCAIPSVPSVLEESSKNRAREEPEKSKPGLMTPVLKRVPSQINWPM